MLDNEAEARSIEGPRHGVLLLVLPDRIKIDVQSCVKISKKTVLKGSSCCEQFLRSFKIQIEIYAYGDTDSC